MVRHILVAVIVLALIGSVVCWEQYVEPFVYLRTGGWVGLAMALRDVPHYHSVVPDSARESVVTLLLDARDPDDPSDRCWCVTGSESVAEAEELRQRLMGLDEVSYGGSFWLSGDGWAVLWTGGVERATAVRTALDGFRGPEPSMATLNSRTAGWCLEAAASFQLGSLPDDYPLLIPLHLLRRLSVPVLFLMRVAAMLTPGGAAGAWAGQILMGGLLIVLASVLGAGPRRKQAVADFEPPKD